MFEIKRVTKTSSKLFASTKLSSRLLFKHILILNLSKSLLYISRNIMYAKLFSLLVLGTFSTLRAEKPNIIYIICDDLGYGDIQCLNPEKGKIPTPHVDKLAAKGMVFTDAHSGSSVCTPTRYGVLTGRYSWRTKLQSGVVQGFATCLITKDR